MAQTHVALQLFKHVVVADVSVGLLVLELDETTEGLEAGVEGHPLNQQVELTWNHVQCHAIVSDQYVVWDVLINQIVQHDTCSVRQSFLCVFKCCLPLLVLNVR